jgi:hypothetical protein
VLPSLTVRVAATPNPHGLRMAIEGALAGRLVGAGPESAVAWAIADAVRLAAAAPVASAPPAVPTAAPATAMPRTGATWR